jgi:hypothetical protein
MIPRIFFRSWLSLGIISLALVANCFGQESTAAVPSKPEVILTKLGPVVYPAIARTAHIAGDVTVELQLRANGSIESATAISGPALLYWAARQSAQQSQFECRDCGDEGTTYRMVYTFHLVESNLPVCGGPDTCGRTYVGQAQPEVTLSGNHVTLVQGLEAVCICDYLRKVRKWKCLYLWRCGY